MAAVNFGPGMGQAVSNDEVRAKSILLTAGSANATAVVKGASGVPLNLAALANDSKQVVMPGSPHAAFHFPGPVTADVVGAGATLRIDY